MNYNNLSQNTNFLAGSSKLELTPFYLTNVNIPGMQFTLPEAGGRGAGKIALGADTIQYNPLSFELQIDEDFKIYHEFMDKIKSAINIENTKFADNTFDFWIQINNSKGNKLFLIEFYDCRIESISDIQLSSMEDVPLVLNVEIKYNYYNLSTNQTVPTIS